MEELIAFSGNPGGKKKKKKKKKRKHYSKNPGKKKGGKRRKKKAGFFPKEPGTVLLGVGGGFLLADLGLSKLGERFSKTDPRTGAKEPLVERGSMTDVLVTGGAALAARWGISKYLKNPALGNVAMISGLTVSFMKLLGTGREEPLGDKIAAGYGMKMRSVFAGVGQAVEEDEIIFIPEGAATDAKPYQASEFADEGQPQEIAQEDPDAGYTA